MINNDTKIVFIGAGRMASAIIRGLIEKEHYKPMQIACTCGNDSTGAQLAKETKIQYLEDITNEIHLADTIVLACKPQQFNQIKKNITDAKKLIPGRSKFNLELIQVSNIKPGSDTFNI